jgi:hypothetical protein
MARPVHGYELDGEPVVGTTTICGLLNKPALVGWAGKTCTDEAWRAGKDGAPKPKWGDILYGKRDDAASAGTLVHELFEAHLRGLPLPEVPDSPIGEAAQRGFANAQRWLEGSAMQITPHETPMVSRRYRYGGTPDALATSGEVVALGDWKTGGIYPEMLVQMAAYRQLLAECAGIEVRGVHLVRSHREFGDFAHHYFDDDALDQGWRVFAGLLAAYGPLKQLEKRVR